MIKRRTEVLFVCTENICRSPMAEGLLRRHLEESKLVSGFKVRSAGTRTSRPGARPDQRAIAAAASAGIRLDRIRAKRLTEKALIRSDLVIAMDSANVRDVLDICPPHHRHKVSLLLSHTPHNEFTDVPDPYYGSVEGFGEVFKLIEFAVLSLIPQLGQLSAQSRRESPQTPISID